MVLHMKQRWFLGSLAKFFVRPLYFLCSIIFIFIIPTEIYVLTIFLFLFTVRIRAIASMDIQEHNVKRIGMNVTRAHAWMVVHASMVWPNTIAVVQKVLLVNIVFLFFFHSKIEFGIIFCLFSYGCCFFFVIDIDTN